PGKALVVGVRRIARTVSSEARARSREIHFDEIRDEDRCDIRTSGFDAGDIGIKYEKVQQLCQFGVFRVLPENRRIDSRHRAAVQIFVCERHKTFVEQRIALSCNLNKASQLDTVVIVVIDFYCPAARCSKDACQLHVAAKVLDGNFQRHEMNVESTLGVLAWTAQLEEIEDRLDIGIEAVITLASKGNVTIVQMSDGLGRIAIELRFSGDAEPGRILTIVSLVVIRRGVTLIVGRHHTRTKYACMTCAVVDLRYRVSLRQILIRIADILNYSKIRLKNRIDVFEVGLELESVRIGSPPCSNVAT